MATVDELQVLITANAAQFEKQMQGVQKQLNAVSQNTSKMSSQASAAFSKMKIAAAAAAVAIGAMVVKSTKEFGNFEQNVGGAKAIFGEYAGFVQKKALEAANSMGMSMNQYMQTVNKIGAIMQGTGMDAKTSLALTSDWMQRAADQASVMGVTTETAMDAITAAAKGNFMLMDNIGVKMTQANIQAYALANGLATAGQEMTEAQKVAAAYAMFMDRTSYAAGNFAREGATTLNGALATLKANFANLGAMLGSAFAPTVQAVALAINNYLIPVLQAVIPYVIGFMNVIGQMVSFVGSALSSLFGGGAKKTNTMKVSANAAAASVGSVGSAATGAGDALGGAAKQAKKLKGQLAGFDEMNVLTEPETGSGGGGGGAGGGGGRGASAPAIDMSGFENFNPFGDMEAKASEVAGKLKKIFDDFLAGFDFAKITAAFSQFWDDVKAFLGPAGKIISDVWHNYIKPMLYWAGNFLLPAALNALGGAIRFVGQVGGAVWGSFLKPFIDMFLVPIAKFTGGVIVGVLNGIGDALRFIAQNKGLTEFFAALITFLGGIVVAVKAAHYIDLFSIALRMNIGSAAAALVPIKEMPAAFMKVGAAVSGLTTAFTAAGGGFAGLKAAAVAAGVGIKTTILGAFSAIMAHPLILAVAGIAAGFWFIGGSIKAAFEAASPAEVREKANEEAIKTAQDNLKNATNELKTAEENLNNARAGRANSEIAYNNAIKQQEQAKRDLIAAEQQYGMTFDSLKEKVDNGTLSYQSMDASMRAVYDAGMQSISANEQVKVSQDELKNKTNELTEAQKENDKAMIDKQAAALTEQAVQDVLAGKYGSVEEAVNDLKDKYAVYTDENGKKSKLNEDQIKGMADKSNEQLDKIKEEYRKTMRGADQGFFGPMGRSLNDTGAAIGGFVGEAGKKIATWANDLKTKAGDAWNGFKSKAGDLKKWAGDRLNDIKNGFSNAKNAFLTVGSNIWNGVKDGIGNLAQKGKELFSGMVNGVKSFLGIHSPSRVFKQLGDYMSQGMAIGVEGGLPLINGAIKKINDSFSVFDGHQFNFGLSEIPDVNSLKNLPTNISQEISAKETPVHVVINIGEDKLVDKIVSGINDASFLKNQPIINI